MVFCAWPAETAPNPRPVGIDRTMVCGCCSLTVSTDAGSVTAISGGSGSCALSGDPAVCQQETACSPAGKSFRFKNNSSPAVTWEYSAQDGSWLELIPTAEVGITLKANTPNLSCGAPSSKIVEIRTKATPLVPSQNLGNIYLRCNPCTP